MVSQASTSGFATVVPNTTYNIAIDLECVNPSPGLGPLGFPLPSLYSVATASNTAGQATVTTGDAPVAVYGCMDATAFNYNELATDDDGYCCYIAGCPAGTIGGFSNLNTPPGACYDDGSCLPVVFGCQDPSMFNYDPLATGPGVCIPYIYGCTESNYVQYNQDANIDDGSCLTLIVYGCTDPAYLEYDASANDGTYNNIHCQTLVVSGCTDPAFTEYNPAANTDDGSCSNSVIYGCMISCATNFNPYANTEDGSCIVINGCTDPAAENYIQGQYVCPDMASCVYFGCMDSNALNYDPLATFEPPNACTYPQGCAPGSCDPFGIMAIYASSASPTGFTINYPPTWNPCVTAAKITMHYPAGDSAPTDLTVGATSEVIATTLPAGLTYATVTYGCIQGGTSTASLPIVCSSC